MENMVPFLLAHLGMDIETRITELNNFLGKQFNSHSRITENDSLCDCQLTKQSV